MRIFSLLLVVDCGSDNVGQCLNGASCANTICTCAPGFTGSLCGVASKIFYYFPFSKSSLFQDVIIFGRKNTFTTFEMNICNRASTNNFKLSVISLMHRDIKVNYTSRKDTYSKQGLQMIISFNYKHIRLKRKKNSIIQ